MKQRIIHQPVEWLARAVAILMVLAGLIAICSPAFAEGIWEVMQEPEFKISFTGVRFFDANHGVAWGNQGHTVRTSNGGEDWVLKQIGAHSGARATYFTGKGQGWVICRGAQDEHTVYHTADGGRNWEEWQAIFAGIEEYELLLPTNVYFLDENLGWLILDTGGLDMKLLHTSDGGEHWELQLDVQKELDSKPALSPSAHLQGVHFLDDRNGWVVGSMWERGEIFGFVFRTRDGGQSWTVSTFSGEFVRMMMVDYVYFRSPDVGWLSMTGDVGLEGKALMHTTDGGETWEKQMDMSVAAIYFHDDREGWAVSGGQILHSLDGGETWETQYKGENWLWLEDVYFINQNDGWAVGAHGVILHTTDGGETWRNQSEFIGALYAVDFINPRNGWVVGNSTMRTHNGNSWTVVNGPDISSLYISWDVEFVNSYVGWIILSSRILHTSDSGLTWTLQFEDKTKGVLQAASFVNEDEGWVVCTNGEIMHTDDGGDTWEAQAGVGPQLNDVFFVDSMRGWAAGQIGGSILDGVVYGTEDGGKTWEKQKGNFTGIKSIHFVNENEGWCSGWVGAPESRIYHTADAGKHWELQSVKPGLVNDVYFVSENEGWLGGESGLIYHTEDGGRSWVIQDSGTDDNLRDICYDGGIHIYAVGRWGTILRYTDPDLRAFGDSVEPSEETFITSWGQVRNALYQNYPNPFNPETWIPYQLASDGYAIIRIYDASGRLVRALHMGQREAGLYMGRQKAARWDGKNKQGEAIGSGVYFYQLVTDDDFSTTKKMLVIR